MTNLASGTLPTVVGTVATVPANSTAVNAVVYLYNTNPSSTQVYIYMNLSGVLNIITGRATIPPNGSASFNYLGMAAGESIAAYASSAGVNYVVKAGIAT